MVGRLLMVNLRYLSIIEHNSKFAILTKWFCYNCDQVLDLMDVHTNALIQYTSLILKVCTMVTDLLLLISFNNYG